MGVKRLIVVILVSITFGLSSAALEVFAQRPPDQRSVREQVRWKYFLDQLALEARTLSDQNTRPEALAAVADAYWEVSPTDSRKLFFGALELALAVEPAGKSRDLAIRRVITFAAKRDRQLASDVVKEALSKKDKAANDQLTKTSLELLKIDPAAAEAVALSSISAGASFDVVWFIFELNKRDSAAPDRVYLAYLNHPTSRSLYRLLWLAGYPFGHVEAFGGSSNPAQFTGVFGVRSAATLTPNRELAFRFLETANQVMAATLELATRAPFEKREDLNSLVFFTLKYLRPESERYRPDLRARWDEMEQLSVAAISPIRRSEVLNKANEILSSRRPSGSEPNLEQSSVFETEMIQRAEKATTSCERDTTFARVALKITQKEDFQRALAIADGFAPKVDCGTDFSAQPLCALCLRGWFC